MIGEVAFIGFLVLLGGLLILCSLAGIVAFIHRPRAERPTSGKSNARVRTEDIVEPIDEADTFCSCRSCGWLGNHEVEIRQHPGWFSIPGKDGAPEVILGKWAEGNPGHYAHRTCWRCGNTWGTPVTAPPKAAKTTAPTAAPVPPPEPPKPVDPDGPFAVCPHCNRWDEHDVEVKQLDAAQPLTFLGKPTGDWTISGPDGLTVAIHRCRSCTRMWHSADEETTV